jgi:hypothetical protein
VDCVNDMDSRLFLKEKRGRFLPRIGGLREQLRSLGVLVEEPREKKEPGLERGSGCRERI